MRPTRLVVSLEAIVHNVGLLRELSCGRPVLAVVKADCYGLGAVPVARALSGKGLARFFGVATLSEALELRHAGLGEDILVLGPLASWEMESAISNRVTPAVYNMASFEALWKAARKLGTNVKAHVKVDSGMGRLGFRADNLDELLERSKRRPEIRFEGVFSTLASADNPASPQTGRQVEEFGRLVRKFEDAGAHPEFVHLANSAGLIFHSSTRFSLVRPGLAMYGMLPSRDLEDPGLRRAVRFETRIMQVKEFPKGSGIGYSAAYVTKRRERMGLLPLGYADGLPRILGQKGAWVIIKGKKAPFRGRISMDLCMVSLEGVDADEGDVVTLWGEDGGLEVTPWDWAGMAETIPYELTCGIGRRVPRLYQ